MRVEHERFVIEHKLLNVEHERFVVEHEHLAVGDERLAVELRESEKEQREHLMVLERMEGLLQQFCRKTERLSYLERLRLRHVQHLQSKVQGVLREEINDSDLLPAFHPTPAVSGAPDKEARALIRKLEPFDRGWYAGPVG